MERQIRLNNLNRMTGTIILYALSLANLDKFKKALKVIDKVIKIDYNDAWNVE